MRIVRVPPHESGLLQGLPGFPPTDPPQITVAALDDSGHPMGWGALSPTHFGWPLGPGVWFAWVHVKPTAARQGVGTALLNTLEDAARAAGVTALSVGYQAGDLAASSFAERHGFRPYCRIVDQDLRLQGFDLTRWEAQVEAVARGGIRFSSLGQETDRAALERAIWELDAQASADVPEFSGEMLPFDTYRKENFHGEGFDPEGVVLAFEGGRLVGFCGTKVEEGEAAGDLPERIGHTWFLGIARSHRRRGIAAALKALTIGWARSRGLRRLTTNNNLENEGIIGVNERMGYAVTAETQYVRKQL